MQPPENNLRLNYFDPMQLHHFSLLIDTSLTCSHMEHSERIKKNQKEPENPSSHLGSQLMNMVRVGGLERY